MGRTPLSEVKEIMDTALKYINSVPYAVSLRWTFYRLYNDGLYSDKRDYLTKFKSLQANWRKQWKYGWRPNTFKDDTRTILNYGIGSKNKEEWIDNLECSLDKFYTQDYFVMVLYEANAMSDQFRYYTKNIPLVAFGGDASIRLKWDIAKQIEWANQRYNKPVVILYFGDADDKGIKIYNSAMTDIKSWCDVDFRSEYCGLTMEQAKKLKLPIGIEGKGYQWEGLSDEQAKEIIISNLEKYIDRKKFEIVNTKEEKILMEVKEQLKNGV